MSLRKGRMAILALSLFPVFLGCQQDANSPDRDQGATNVVTNLSDQQTAQLVRAIEAKDDLFNALINELTSVLEAEGPVRAIPVCKEKAPQLAEQVSHERGLKIGRTSFDLRNTDNQPPAWAAKFVANRVEEKVTVALASDRLGVLLPIRMKETCLLCHGQRNQLMPDVKAALSYNYPDDQATGFEVGDLRGYFWIDVPAESKSGD